MKENELNIRTHSTEPGGKRGRDKSILRWIVVMVEDIEL